MSGRCRNRRTQASGVSDGSCDVAVKVMESAYQELLLLDAARAADGSPETETRTDDGHCQRSQANARERFRTHSVNSAFTNLRLLIPTEPRNRKLSKIETLRLAKSYISHLIAILITGNLQQPCLQAQIDHPVGDPFSEFMIDAGTLSAGGSDSSPGVEVTEMQNDDYNVIQREGFTTQGNPSTRATICTFCVSPKGASKLRSNSL
ncbi:pancreas transcription factor 1 subunit alpha isoform X2 [Malaya genurostris]|uniref:pancreas transcription factor 1 subunit alpha isoform X2 n=1 Tax=Malaya genurostris TaxID=325434 RepID=UPI0026F392C8|nr:pancreas transcription factor 1 subunit alpha isoform X2 [Malaya genurostris]